MQAILNDLHEISYCFLLQIHGSYIITWKVLDLSTQRNVAKASPWRIKKNSGVAMIFQRGGGGGGQSGGLGDFFKIRVSKWEKTQHFSDLHVLQVELIIIFVYIINLHFLK